jgi:hypothetical protein
LYRRCRYAPANVRRYLRQEAGFGCAYCGNPLLENAHIIPFHESREFPVEHMVALCPNHHTEADLGHISEEVLRDWKKNPYNKNRSVVGKKFIVTGRDVVVHMGSNDFVNTHGILCANNFDLISLTRIDDSYLSLDINLFDRFQRWVALAYENNWMVDRRYFWDIEYKPQHLVLRNAPREIVFDIRIEDEEIFIKGNLFFKGQPIHITSSSFSFATKQIDNNTFNNIGLFLEI